MRPAGTVAEIRGRLHVRLFNVGSRSRLDCTGMYAMQYEEFGLIVEWNSGIV